MNEWLIRWRKLKFTLTPPRCRSPFCKDDPWLAKYEIGDWTYGRVKVLAWSNKANLRIGRFSSIGGGTTIFLDGGEHNPTHVTTYPLRLALPKLETPEQTVATKEDVEIGNDVWIGDAATLLSGVRIGNGAVIGARSVVTKDVPPYAIAVGNPARIARLRFTPEQISALERIAWWNWPLHKIREAAPLLVSPSIEEFIALYSSA
jgi:virginiamycin A acetyltransferase